nr:hypothetical protein [Escherichia coli]
MQAKQYLSNLWCYGVMLNLTTMNVWFITLFPGHIRKNEIASIFRNGIGKLEFL